MSWFSDRWGQGGIFGKTGLAGAVNWDRNRGFYGNLVKNAAIPVALAADYFTGGALTPLEAGLISGGGAALGQAMRPGTNIGSIAGAGVQNGLLGSGVDSLASAFAPGAFSPAAPSVGMGAAASPTDPAAALRLSTSGMPSMADAPGASSALMDQAMGASPTNPLASAFAPSSAAPAVAPGLADADVANDEFAAAGDGPADQPGSLTGDTSASGSNGLPKLSNTGIGTITGAPSTPIAPGTGPAFSSVAAPKSIGDSILSGVKGFGSFAAKNPNTIGMGLQALSQAPLNEAQTEYTKYQLARLKQQNTALDPLRAAIFGAYAKNATARPTPFTTPTPYTLPTR